MKIYKGYFNNRNVLTYSKILDSTTSSDSLKESFRNKMKRYKFVEKPLLLAFNILEDESVAEYNPLHDSAFRTIFGDVMVDHQALKSHIYKVNPNGLLTQLTSEDHNYKKISGILISKGLTLWNCDKKDVELLHNPRAKFPLENTPLDYLNSWKIENGILIRRIGIPAFSALKLQNTEWNYE